MKNLPKHYLLLQMIAGALLGILVFYPLTTFIFWFEFNNLLATPASGAWDFLRGRLQSSLLIELGPMNVIFALIGVACVYVIGSYTRKLDAEHRRVLSLENELSRHLPSMIGEGEGERLEFKST